MPMKGWAVGAGLVRVSHTAVSSLGLEVFFLKWLVEWRLRLGPKWSPVSGQSALSCRSQWWEVSQTVTLHGLCLLFQKAGKDTQPYTYDFTGRPSQDPPPQARCCGGGGGDKPPSRSSRLWRPDQPYSEDSSQACSFPRAAMRKYHRSGGLKQHS